MDESCKDCFQVKNLEDKIKSVWNALNEEKDRARKAEERITELEIAKGEHKKDFERIFDSIAKIEGNIAKIARAVDDFGGKDSKTFHNLKYEVLKYIVIAVLAALVAALAKIM